MTSEIHEQLYDLERQLHSYAVRSNRDLLTTLLSPNFFEFGASGRLWTRQDILDRLPTEDGKTRIEARDFRAHSLSSDIILVTYISRRISEDATSHEFLRSSVWKKHGESWKMEFHQGTPAASN